MKKKTKVILSLASITSIGSLVVGASLGCAIYHDSTTKTTLTQTKKDATSSPTSTTLATTSDNSSVTYNDNAYLQTINQTGTPNPFPGA